METCDVRLSINSTAHSLYLFLFICFPPLTLIDLSLFHLPASANDYLISGQPKKRMPSSLFLFSIVLKGRLLIMACSEQLVSLWDLVLSCGKLAEGMLCLITFFLILFLSCNSWPAIPLFCCLVYSLF